MSDDHLHEHDRFKRPFRLPVDEHARPGRLRIVQRDWEALLGRLLGDGDEHAALLICGLRETAGTMTFLTRETVLLKPEDYITRGALHLSVAPTALARVAKRARMLDAAVIMVHSHPFPGRVVASQLDLRTESDLCRRVLTSRTRTHSAALVVGPDGVDGRVWSADGAGPFERIDVVGDSIVQFDVTSDGLPSTVTATRERPNSHLSTVVLSGESATARQELLWGAEGQARLRGAHVVVVGVGGTGSHVATQLAHLRVGRLTLIDHDVVEPSNLSRIVGLGPDDVGRGKAGALTSKLQRIHPECVIEAIEASVLDVDPAVLTGADVIVCATDSHGSRSLLNDLVHQYLVPVVDLGVEVVPGTNFRAGGGVRLLRPGSGCLWCAQTLSPAMVREEYLSADERAQEAERGYLRGSTAPAPSVVALNGVAASLAVLEVCQLLVGMLGSARARLLYRAEQRGLTTASMGSLVECHVCGTDGLHAKGDSARVKTRWRRIPACGA